MAGEFVTIIKNHTKFFAIPADCQLQKTPIHELKNSSEKKLLGIFVAIYPSKIKSNDNGYVNC